MYTPKHNREADYINAKLSGIVAFRIDATRIEARFKLSHDRTASERENITGQSAKSDDPLASEIGGLMKEHLRQKSLLAIFLESPENLFLSLSAFN